MPYSCNQKIPKVEGAVHTTTKEYDLLRERKQSAKMDT